MNSLSIEKMNFHTIQSVKTKKSTEIFLLRKHTKKQDKLNIEPICKQIKFVNKDRMPFCRFVNKHNFAAILRLRRRIAGVICMHTF